MPQVELDRLQIDGYDVTKPLGIKEALELTGLSSSTFGRRRDQGKLPELGLDFIKSVDAKGKLSYTYFQKKTELLN